MLHHLIAFLLLLYSVDALSPGAQIQISQAGINQAVQSLLRQVLVMADSFEIPEKRDGGVRIFDLVGSIKLDPKNAQVHLRDNGEIFVHIHTVEMEITGQGSYERKMLGFRVFKTTASLRVKTENTFLELTLGVVNENGRPRILNKGARFDIGKLHIYVKENILSRLIEKTLDAFKGRFKSRANEAVINILNKKLQEFSDKLANIETEKELKGYFRNHGLSADYGLAANPGVANSAFIIPVVTQFWHNGHKNSATPSSGPYPFGAPWQMACIDIDSKLVIGSALHALHLSKFKVHKTFAISLPGKFKNDLVNKFLSNTEMKVNILNADRNIHFNNSGAFLSMSGNGSADVVANGITTRVLDVDFAFTVHLMQNIVIENWNIKGTANVYKTKLSAKALIFGELDKEAMNTAWETEIKPHIKRWIDELAGPGIPLPKLEFANFCNARIGFNGPFVRFCSDIDFKFEKLLGHGSATPSGICPAEQSSIYNFNSAPLPVSHNNHDNIEIILPPKPSTTISIEEHHHHNHKNVKEQQEVTSSPISEQEKLHDHEGIEDEQDHLDQKVESFASSQCACILQVLTLFMIICFNQIRY